MAVECVVGLQWGDEGKGKVVDVLSEGFDMIVRFAGGANAGHTVVVEGEKFVLHLIPTGILHPGKICIIANGVVFDPEAFFVEVEELHRRGVETVGRLFVSERTHIVFPFHKQLDHLREEALGPDKIGTTARGIGPCYADKAARLGIRVCDLLEPETLAGMLKRSLTEKNVLLTGFGHDAVDEKSVLEKYIEYGEKLKPYVRGTHSMIAGAIERGRDVLFEGAQGALLDIDHGTYPFVTSSNTGLDGIASGAGIPVRGIDRVTGIMKSYCTRVGDGPFPTELSGPAAEYLQTQGGEFGATTGRPRRCGWLDLVAVRYSAAINSVDAITMTKLDVLTGLEEIKVATSYEVQGCQTAEFPASAAALRAVRPSYESFEGWQDDITGARSVEELPDAARKYLNAVEELLGIPFASVSIGNSRKQIINLER